MATKPSIAIVGPGRLGSTLARELPQNGYTVAEIVARGKPAQRVRKLASNMGARISIAPTALLNADLIWFCVPDQEIASAARHLADRTEWKGKTAFHSSGALSSEELNVLRQQGAAVASVHPFMTFVAGSMPSLTGVPFALEGDAAALRLAGRIVRKLGGQPFRIARQDKAAYHAWGFFSSPLLVAALVTAEQAARTVGLSAAEARKKMLPIVRQTIANYAELGPAGAFSGPLARGDTEIVRKHLRTLRKLPQARDVYLALTRAALRYLPVRNRKQLMQSLRPPR